MTSQEWSIKRFYKKAYTLTKQNKRLWIVGLAVTILVASTSTNSSSNFSDSFDTSDTNQSPQQTTTQETTPTDTTESFTLPEGLDKYQVAFTRAQETITLNQDLFPIPAIITAGLLTILIAIAFIPLGIYVRSWITATLIISIDQADQKQLSIPKASQIAMSKAWSFFWLSFKPWLVFILLTIVSIIAISVLVAVLGFFDADILVAISFALTLIIGLILFIYYAASITAKIIWAEREFLLKDNPVDQALAHGKILAYKRLGKMALLGTANFITSIIITSLASIPWLAVNGTVAALLYITWDIERLWTTIAVGLTSLVLSTLVFSPLTQLASAIVNVFIYSTWHYAYLYITNLPPEGNHEA